MKAQWTVVALAAAAAGCFDGSESRRDDLIVAPACRHTGCSSQLCSDQDLVTTCEYREEYACFQAAVCERQADGACGFTPSPELTACLGGGATDAGPAPCHRGGCSGQLCSDQEGLGSTCEWREEYACYQAATCERQGDGACGFTPSPELSACLGGGAIDAGPAPCHRGGCSGQLCSDQEGLVSTCEYREEYACFQAATCERQADGACRFTPSAALSACLDDAHQ